jgi:hypothetical protein
MKESELIKKMNSITNHLERTKLVDKAYELARIKGKGSTERYSYHTHLNYAFSKEGLLVELDDGQSQWGGGNIIVTYNREVVLSGDRDAKNKLEYRFNPEISGFKILIYQSGEWEDKIKTYLKQKNKKQVKKELEVSKEMLNYFSTNFNIKI